MQHRFLCIKKDHLIFYDELIGLCLQEPSAGNVLKICLILALKNPKWLKCCLFSSLILSCITEEVSQASE